jgi:hypothetical protein
MTTRRLAPTVYDPAIASDGLTLDTPAGPVDLIAIERVLAGRPGDPLTEAEYAYLAALGKPRRTATRQAAAPVRPDQSTTARKAA